jgi:tetratricopeptide (TPR) repeat protein
MSFWNRLLFSVCAVWLGVALSGCAPPGQSQSDEEKEPHYVLGKNRVNAMDFQGAIEAFKESLEVNPRSASAHFELGWLYDEKEPDPSAAIYHYRQYLELCPNADNAEVIKQRVYSCKQQLAADIMPLSSAPAMQKQLDQLAEQNRQLQDEVNKWRAYYASQLAAATTNSSSSSSNVLTRPAAAKPVKNAQPTAANTNRSGSATATIRPHTHTVASGETVVGIARKYGVKLSALQTANPGMNSSRIRVGQVLNIPSP